MTKTILITGSTDGIGLETAKILAGQGHSILLHGRNESKLADTRAELSQLANAGPLRTYQADLSRISDIETLASAIAEDYERLDVLINNAGVFQVSEPLTEQGIDVRFMVNTLAPWLLTQRLLPLLPPDGRVINLSSAAQAAVSLDALAGRSGLTASQAYAQSKLAITMWSAHLAHALGEGGPAIIAVNPASFLGSKMVKDAYGVDGGDLRVGADILVRAALSDEFASASGQYFDNDKGRFTAPHADALDALKNEKLVEAIELVLAGLVN